MMIKHLVFDFGGVFLDLGGVPSGIPAILAQIFDLPLEQTTTIWYEERIPLATGKESATQFLIRMKQKLGLSFEIDRSLALWQQKYLIPRDRIDWGLVDLVTKLEQKYKLHLLTDQINLNNGSSSQFPEIEKHFQTILRSYEQGLSKPDPAAFQNLLVKIQAQAEPASVVFIDDIEKNIQAANKLGIHGILYHFKDHTTLTIELGRLGVL